MGKLRDPPKIDVEKAKRILRSRWEKISDATSDFIDKPWVTVIRDLVNSETKSYRYAVVTQVLGKTTDPSIDCRWLTARRGFGARSFCTKVLVPFDQEFGRVLGGSMEPYVSKPLRHNELSPTYSNEIRDKEGWESLCSLMDEIQSEDNPKFTDKVLNQILLEIYRRLSKIKVTYPEPRQVSTDETIRLIEEYTSESSGGLRPEVIIYSLFRNLAKKFNLFADVDYSKITAPNQMMGRAADVQCYDTKGNIELAVSIKDIELEKLMVKDDVRKLHEKGVHNLILMAFKGMKENEIKNINNLIKREQAIGYDIDIMALPKIEIRGIISLFGAKYRATLLKKISDTLEEMTAPYEHRKRWAELLATCEVR